MAAQARTHRSSTLRGFVLFLVGTLSLTAALEGGTTGKVTGVVKDTKSGEPLIGANVRIEGTTLGAATDIDGRYVILNVAPGAYSMVASMVGYAQVRITDVRIKIDLTTSVDIQMTESVVQLNQEMVVVAQRPLVQKDQTASTAVINDRDIQALPVTEFSDILNLQAGVVAGHFRGGRSGEVSYWIDGVPVTDSFDGSTVVDVNKNSIQEMQLVTGAFNAEYGKAMSGIVNIATKNGSNTMTGGVTAYGGGYLTGHSDIFAGLQKVNPVAVQNVEASLSGSIVDDRLFYYVNGRYYYYEGALLGVRKFNPWDITNSLDPNAFNWKIQQSGDGKVVPMAPYLKGYAQAKLTYRISGSMQVAYNYIVDNSRGKDYDFAFKYNPDGELSNFKRGYLNNLTLTHTLSSTTFYTLGASYFFKDDRRFLDQDPFTFNDLIDKIDPLDPGSKHPKQQYVHTALLQAPEATFLSGGTNMFYGLRNTDTYIVKFDLTSQITNGHQIKFGIEADQYKLYLHNINLRMSDVDNNRDPIRDGNPYLLGPVVIPSLETQDNQQYLHKPQQVSAYIQDKIEFQSLIINLGVRLDWFNPDGKVLSDPSDPNIYLPLRPENQDSVVAPGGTHADAVAARMRYWYKQAGQKWQVSPRLGIAFPITDKGIIHFSYGLFFQIPDFQRLYENPDYKLRLGGSTNLGIIGNPNLSPEKTTSGELGLQQQFGDDISFDVTGYFRDVRDLAGTLNEVQYVFTNTAIYGRYVNTDFGFIRGLVVSMEKRFSDGISASLDYTFQIAKGNQSDPAAAFNLRNSGVQPETQLIPLNWDQRQTFNATLNYASADDWGGSLIFQFGSGTPYTPALLTNVGQLIYNSGVKPTTYNLDARVYKNFKVGPVMLSIFLRVNNLLDMKNATNVFNDTGQPDFSLVEQQYLRINPPQRIATITDWYTRPSYYSEPRRFELGTSISF